MCRRTYQRPEARHVFSAFVRVPMQHGTKKAKRIDFFFSSFPWRLLFSAQQLNAILAAKIRISTKTNQMAIKEQKRKKD